MNDAPPKPSAEKQRPTLNIIAIDAGYICIPNDSPGRSREGAAPRLPVVAIAERGEGNYHACILDMEGRLQFTSGPIYPEGASHDATSSAKALQEISSSLKTLVTLGQQRAK